MVDFRKYHYFDYEKTIQLLGYIQRKSRVTDKLTLIKLLFLSDRVHLRRHFALITHDIYYALKNGPAPSKTLNVINRYEDFLDTTPENLKFLEKVEIVDKSGRIIKETKTDCLSNNEMKIVDMITDLFGSFPLSALIDITHDYPEWKRWEDLLNKGLTDGELIQMDDFFKNPDINNSPALTRYFNGIDPLYEEEDYLNEAREFYYTCEELKNAYQ